MKDVWQSRHTRVEEVPVGIWKKWRVEDFRRWSNLVQLNPLEVPWIGHLKYQNESRVILCIKIISFIMLYTYDVLFTVIFLRPTSTVHLDTRDLVCYFLCNG